MTECEVNTFMEYLDRYVEKLERMLMEYPDMKSVEHCQILGELTGVEAVRDKFTEIWCG